jgi:hypothetical protein
MLLHVFEFMFFADVIICDTFCEGIAHKIAEYDRGLGR